jgi:tetratricopeptide (TPR) repeat protein
LTIGGYLLSQNSLSYYVGLVRPDRSNEFRENLVLVDRMINGGGYSSAFSYLKKSKSFAQTSSDWMRILKRAYWLAEETGEKGFLDNSIEDAFDEYPGNEQIRAFRVYSLLEQGLFDEASELSRSLSNLEFNNLKVEAALSAEFASDTIADPFSYLLDLLERTDDPDIFRRIGEITGNKKLLFDAAVLFMKKGDVKSAYREAADITGSWVNDEAIGMIAIDAGEYSHALTRFISQNDLDIRNHNERWAIQLIIGDLSQLNKRVEEADRFYRRSLEINSEGSWHQYANFSRLLKTQGRFRQSMTMLQDAINFFPEKEKELVVSMVKNQFDKNRSTTERYLKSFLDRNPDDPEANLLVIEHFPIQTTPEKYSARIWELYNKNPSNRAIAEFLIWYLLGVGDLEGTTLVLDRFDRDSGRSYWTVFYRALSLSMNKGFNEAEILLNESIEMKETWYAYYNLAVIQLFLGKYSDALTNLQEGEVLLLRTGKIEDSYLSGIKTKYAVAYIGLNQLDNAGVALREALKLNSDNLEAALLTREIQ